MVAGVGRDRSIKLTLALSREIFTLPPSLSSILKRLHSHLHWPSNLKKRIVANKDKTTLIKCVFIISLIFISMPFYLQETSAIANQNCNISFLSPEAPPFQCLHSHLHWTSNLKREQNVTNKDKDKNNTDQMCHECHCKPKL